MEGGRKNPKQAPSVFSTEPNAGLDSTTLGMVPVDLGTLN